MANFIYEKDKHGRQTEKVYINSGGSKTRWKTWSDGHS
jgi:hypothetical protein